jgi:hypothetical protein
MKKRPMEAFVPSNIALKVRRQIREIYDFARSKKALPEEVLYEVTEEIASIIEGIFPRAISYFRI